MERLRVGKPSGREEMRYALEAALLLGFQSETAVFPVASPDGEIRIPGTEDELAGLWKLEDSVIPEGYLPAEKKGPVFDLDFRKEKGLEYLFSKGLFLQDEDADMLPDKLAVKLVLPDDADEWMLMAACNIAFRFGMETTAYEGGILAPEGYEGNAVVFSFAEQAEVTYQETSGAVRVHIAGKGKELLELSNLLCEKFPLADGIWKNWRDVLLDWTDDFAMRGADGQLAYLSALSGKKEGLALYGALEISEEQKKHFPEAQIYSYKSGKKIYEKNYEFPWEADIFEQVLREEIYPKLEQGDRIRVEGAVSEDYAVREKISERIRKEAGSFGAEAEEVRLICAYKQGYSWMDEVVIPAVRGQKTDQIEIFFKPFLPEGETLWLDENGATPSYHNLKADDPERWYDLPIRYLQELYPIQDILTEKLSVPEEKVVFKAYEGSEELTYLCRVTDKDGCVREFKYLARYSERPYLDEYPNLGKVHPATGYIRVLVNEKEVLNRKLTTDLERIWDIYQSQVLPECRAYIEEKTKGQAHADMQPFFQKLALEVWASEPDYRTGSREDLISSLDALHEDMYFVGSDYFKNYGVRTVDEIFDAPGLILPEIHKREGAPQFRVTLYERQKEEACILCREKEARDGQEVLEKERNRDQISLKISRITCKDGKLLLEIPVKGAAEDVVCAYAKLFSEGILSGSREIGGCYEIHFTGESGGSYEAAVPSKTPVPERSITEINLHEKELIGYETCLEVIEELKGVKGIRIFETARSYQGRKLYGIWILPHYEGYLSMTKRLSRCPSEIINARHHANEVSSTNAAFILLKKLLTEDIYKDLPQKLNLVLVPMENVDGAAIHYELQKEHPYWKFHVARFNAIGKEFYHDHFRQDTIHREAMGLTRLFDKYIPDMIVDNHGVPSHEWEQQFSGYTSPSYKGFWLPRSLLYGYFWYVTDSEYKDNYPVNKKMEDVIADKIAEDSEMAAWNREWSAQFEKYAHAWMPKLFPADYYKDMINYWIPFAFDKNHRYPSIRFPWITTVAYTSEVADETAQGEYLNLCARAHVAHDEATLQMLMDAVHIRRCRFMCRDGEIFAEYLRLRPMIVEGSEKR